MARDDPVLVHGYELRMRDIVELEPHLLVLFFVYMKGH